MAYAAVSSAKKKVERFLHSFQSKHLLHERAKFTHAQLSSLQSALILYTSRQGRNLRFDPLEQHIEDVADKVVDLIESLVPSYKSQGSKREIKNLNIVKSTTKLLGLAQEIASLERKASIELHKTTEKHRHGISYDVNPRAMSCGELVGSEDEERVLMDWLVGGHESREVLSVVGMAGIGKTVLVQQVYNHPTIVSHFDTRIMVTVGPNLKEDDFLQAILDYEGVLIQESDDLYGCSKVLALGQSLIKLLNGRSYLIVLDDLWGETAWLKIEKWFPANNTRSRIILTTRLLSVARCQSNIHIHEKSFMDDEESWNLLRKTVFTSPTESCSFQLEKIGRKIAKNCEGLPLAIISIGQLLCKAEKTVEYWQKISEDENPLGIGIDDNSPISKSLALSYDNLPRYLKVCFIYIGLFPRSYKISVTELIKLWDIEAFIPALNSSVEDAAERWLDDLISRSVVLVHEESSTSGKTKTCKSHFVFRNLCISIAQKEKFCYILNKYAYSFPQDTNKQQRLCIHNNVMLSIKGVSSTMESISSVRSLLCLGSYHPYPLRVHLKFRLLKILNALRIRFFTFPHEILELVRLEYLAITYNGELPKSISKLHNLEVLIVGEHLRIKSLNVATYLPLEIWNLKWLKHFQCMGFDLPDPCTDGTTLEHLLTLSGVSAHSCTEGVLARMCKLKKLGVRIVLTQDEEETFSFLSNVAKLLPDLQSFKCEVSGFNSQVISQVPDFPNSIVKITLSGCKFSWKCIETFQNLNDLRVLKLRWNSFCGSVWEPCKWRFSNLEFLMLEDLDVEKWVARNDHFPKLERLIIRHCYKLREIPTSLADIEALKLIEVEDGCSSLVTSVQQIQKIHKQKHENSHLQVHIHSSWKEKKDKARP